MLHSGLDLHKRTLVISTVNDAGEPVDDVTLPTTRTAVRTYFERHAGPHQAVVESTANWYWLRDLLAPSDVALTLAHAKNVKAISYAKVKTDAIDAATLAQLLRANLVPTAHMISADHREARDLLRARLQWVTQQVRCRNAIAGLLAQHNVTTPSALPALTQVRAAMLDAQLTLLRQQAKAVQHALQPQLIPTADVQRLVWIPGIGTIVAFTLVLEIDDIARFPNAKAFVSYCRLVPGAGNSGGKLRQKRTKDGNRYLKLAFSHAAIRAIQYSPEIRRFYQALARRKPKAVARAVVAKELARIVYVVLSRQVDFNHTFKGKPLSTRKASQWPRLSSPSV
jgi:transposase